MSRSQTSSPISRRFQRRGRRTACVPRAPLRPGDAAVLEHERRAGGVDAPPSSSSRSPRATPRGTATRTRLRRSVRGPLARSTRRCAARTGARARSTGPPGPRSRAAARSRPRENSRSSRVRTLSAPSSFSRMRIGYGEDRLVFVLGQVRERLEARVEMRLRREHDRLASSRRRAGDALPGPHARPAGHLLDARAVRCAQHELVRRARRRGRRSTRPHRAPRRPCGRPARAPPRGRVSS